MQTSVSVFLICTSSASHILGTFPSRGWLFHKDITRRGKTCRYTPPLLEFLEKNSYIKSLDFACFFMLLLYNAVLSRIVGFSSQTAPYIKKTK